MSRPNVNVPVPSQTGHRTSSARKADMTVRACSTVSPSTLVAASRSAISFLISATLLTTENVTPRLHNEGVRLTITQLAERVVTEADAYDFLEELRWAGEPRCPHCGSYGADFI